MLASRSAPNAGSAAQAQRMKAGSPSRIILGRALRAEDFKNAGEIEIPQFVIPTIEIPGVLQSVASGLPGNLDQSAMASARLAALGATGALTSTIFALAKGAWRIRWSYQGHFVGTTNT